MPLVYGLTACRKPTKIKLNVFVCVLMGFQIQPIERLSCWPKFHQTRKPSTHPQLSSNLYIGYGVIYVVSKAFSSTTIIHWSLSSITGESLFYHDGSLIKTESINVEGLDNAIMDAEGMYDKAFIFGQEPDIIRGAYDKNEAFLGDLVELNIWSKRLVAHDMKKMASCEMATKGNILAWEKSNFNLYNGDVEESLDLSELCIKPEKYVIFPVKLSYRDAKEICTIHGGKLALPKSEVENQKIVDIVFKHRKTCIENTQSGLSYATWIGAKKQKQRWYDLDGDGGHGELLNYTNVLQSGSTPNTDCAYLQSDGAWLDSSNVCKGVSLCTICLIKDEPIITVKGVCFLSEIDWNYYINVDDETYQLTMYEGYKRTNIKFDKNSKSWNISSKLFSLSQSLARRKESW